MEKPYHLSRQFTDVKNASQEEEANVGVMWLEGWPGLQLLFSMGCIIGSCMQITE